VQAPRLGQAWQNQAIGKYGIIGDIPRVFALKGGDVRRVFPRVAAFGPTGLIPRSSPPERGFDLLLKPGAAQGVVSIGRGPDLIDQTGLQLAPEELPMRGLTGMWVGP